MNALQAYSAMLIVLCRMPRDAPYQGTKRGRGSVDLVIVGTIWEGAQLVNKGSIPLSFHELDHALLTLRGEWVGAPFFASMFRFDRY